MRCSWGLLQTSNKRYIILELNGFSIYMINGEVDNMWFQGGLVTMNYVAFEVCL